MEIFEEQNALWVLEDTDIYKYRLIELWQNNILLSYTESDIVCISAEVSLFRLCYNLIYKNKNKENEIRRKKRYIIPFFIKNKK